jgi:hypothetical protein
MDDNATQLSIIRPALTDVKLSRAGVNVEIDVHPSITRPSVTVLLCKSVVSCRSDIWGHVITTGPRAVEAINVKFCTIVS